MKICRADTVRQSPYMELIILYLSVALAISFLCSILEAVLLSTPMSFIAMKEQEGAKYAPRSCGRSRISTNPSRQSSR